MTEIALYNFRPAAGARRRRGFTLVELLVVIALTSILLFLLFGPLINSFNLASRAGTQIDSQTAARELMRQINAELSGAVYVYENQGGAAMTNLWLRDKSSNAILEQSPSAMMEFLAPARQLDQNPGNLPTDPTTGLPIYPSTLPGGVRSFALPLEPGRALTRYFVGLQDNRSGPDTHNFNAAGEPFNYAQSGMPAVPTGGNTFTYHGYANRWADPSLSGEDNRFTLYKATVLPYTQDPDNPSSYIVNLRLFHTNTNPNLDSKTGSIILDDPNFFYDNSLAGDSTSKGDKKWAVPGWQDLEGDGKVHIWENWRAVATTMLPTVSVDALTLDRDKNGNVIFDANNRPIARSLFDFTPGYVQNEAVKASSVSAEGAETPLTAAPSFVSQYGAWQLPYTVMVYRASAPNNDPLGQNPLTYYQFYMDPNTGLTKIVFQQVNQGAQPANPATLPDVGPDIDPTTGFFTSSNPQFAFTVDPARGLVNFAFPQWVYVHDANNNHEPQRYDPNAVDAGMTGAYNSRYVWLQAALPTTNYSFSDPFGPPFVHALNPPGVPSPLGLLDTVGPDNPLQTVQIVPGTERVFGPDQRPGAHYGYRIEYTRVPGETAVVGPDEYRINYIPSPNASQASDPNDPRVMLGYLQFDSQPDEANYPNFQGYYGGGSPGATVENPIPGPSTNYRPHSLPTAKYDPNDPQADANGVAPADPVEVSYEFQMNRPSDTVESSYTTRDVIGIGMRIRLYDPATASPQDTALTDNVLVRNLQR